MSKRNYTDLRGGVSGFLKKIRAKAKQTTDLESQNEVKEKVAGEEGSKIDAVSGSEQSRKRGQSKNDDKDDQEEEEDDDDDESEESESAPSTKRQKLSNENNSSHNGDTSSYNKHQISEYSKTRENYHQDTRPPDDLPRNLRHFWYGRYNLFSRFDEGIILSPTMWYSVTPENVARVISDQISLRYPKARAVVDAFGGAGGNTIQFAHDFEKVVYLDIEKENVEMAKNNCRIYEVLDEKTTNEEPLSEKDRYLQRRYGKSANKIKEKGDNDTTESDQVVIDKLNAKEYKNNRNIEFYLGDFFKFKYPPLLDSDTKEEGKPRVTRDDVVFLSPPWGGISYSKDEVWSLAKCEPYSIQATVQRARELFSENIVLYLPRNSDLDEIVNDKVIFPDLEDSTVKKSLVPGFYLNHDGRCKALLLFLGPGLKPLKYDIYK